jgi:hypothetical protein
MLRFFSFFSLSFVSFVSFLMTFLEGFPFSLCSASFYLYTHSGLGSLS